MARELHYMVVAFQADRRCSFYPFLCAVDAEEGARILARDCHGVIAYQQWGDASAGLWDEPDVLLILGRVPRDALEDQAPEGEWIEAA